jgi:hypothetical protein
MESSKENKLSAQEVLKKWTSDVRQDISSRYTYGNRKEHIENLMGYLKMHDVDKDDAQFLKNKVVEVLVTEEGRKGKGKHKGWKENVENDFDDAIQQAYVPGLSSEIKPIKTAQGYDPRIYNWCKAKFGNHVGENIIKAAHQPLHTFWIMCMEDSFPDFFPKRRVS